MTNIVKTHCVLEIAVSNRHEEYFTSQDTKLLDMREATEKQLEAVAMLDAGRDADGNQYVLPGVGEYFFGSYFIDEEWS